MTKYPKKNTKQKTKEEVIEKTSLIENEADMNQSVLYNFNIKKVIFLLCLILILGSYPMHS